MNGLPLLLHLDHGLAPVITTARADEVGQLRVPAIGTTREVRRRDALTGSPPPRSAPRYFFLRYSHLELSFHKGRGSEVFAPARAFVQVLTASRAKAFTILRAKRLNRKGDYNILTDTLGQVKNVSLADGC